MAEAPSPAFDGERSPNDASVSQHVYENDPAKSLMSVAIPAVGGSKPPLLRFISINVVDTERRMNEALSLKDYYTVFLVETKVTKEGFTNEKKQLVQFSSVWRRYTEFEWLKYYLESKHPQILVPPLPEKRATFPWTMTPGDNFDASFVERRRQALEAFLLRIGNHPVLSNDVGFIDFLQDENLDTSGSDIWDKADAKLKFLTASFRTRDSNKTFEELRNYAVDLHNNLETILGTRAKLAERLFGIHKLHSNYGRVFSEWSAIEKQLGDPLQTAGHHLDNYASWIEGCLDEDESVCELIKEYYFYADSLKMLCDRYAVAQFEVDRAEENRMAKVKEREAIAAGKNPGGFFSKFLLGVGYTEDEKEARVVQLTKEIDEATTKKEFAEENLKCFLAAAEKELQDFKKQKSEDLNAALVQYAKIQLDIARKGLRTWTNVQDTLERA